MKTVIASYKSMRLAYLLVLLTLAFLPWLMVINPIPILLLLTTAVVFMAATRQKGLSFVIVAIAMCLPHMSGVDKLGPGMQMLHYVIYFNILVAFILTCVILSDSTPLSRTLGKVLVLLSISILVVDLRFDLRDLQQWLYQIILCPMFFWVCYKSKESWDDIYYLFTLIFLFVSVYALMEFFLSKGPYVGISFDDDEIEFSLFPRARGILGNALIMCGMAVGYHTFLIINYFRSGKISIFLCVYSLFVMLTTGSRTALYVTGAVWLISLLYLNGHNGKKNKKIFAFLFAGLLLLFVADYFLHDFVELYFDRFSERSEHREAGIKTAMNIFNDNPLGVGRAGRDFALEKYAAPGFIVRLNTLDNMYLTLLVQEGVLCFIPFFFYFYITIHAFSLSKKNRAYRIIVLYFMAYALCGLSFNIEAFLQLSVIFFGIAGHMYRIVQNDKTYGSINHNCQLQHA